MKILQVNKYHYPRGGADRYYLDLGDRLEKMGHQVAYFSMQHPNNLPSIWSKYFISRVSYNENLRKYAWKISGRTIYSLEAKRKFRRLLNDFKPDVIHIHNIYHQISPSILDVAAKHKIPVVMHAHDYKLVCPSHNMYVHGEICDNCIKENYGACIKKRCVKDSFAASLLASTEMFIHHRILKIYKKNITKIISPSLFLKTILMEAGWPKNKIMVVNNCCSLKTEESPTDEINDYFLFNGRLSQEKGIDLIINAVINHPELRLIIAGTGPDALIYEKMANAIEAKDRIQFIGWQEEQALAKLILKAKAVLIPSRWYENFPLSALEAISLGTPVIASNRGGLPEIINDTNGLLITADDPELWAQAMLSVISGKKQWTKETIKISAAKYSPDINTNNIIQIYNSVINSQ